MANPHRGAASNRRNWVEEIAMLRNRRRRGRQIQRPQRRRIEATAPSWSPKLSSSELACGARDASLVVRCRPWPGREPLSAWHGQTAASRQHPPHESGSSCRGLLLLSSAAASCRSEAPTLGGPSRVPAPSIRCLRRDSCRRRLALEDCSSVNRGRGEATPSGRASDRRAEPGWRERGGRRAEAEPGWRSDERLAGGCCLDAAAAGYRSLNVGVGGDRWAGGRRRRGRCSREWGLA